MMVEDRELSRHMKLPHPGIGACARVDLEYGVDRPIVAPTSASPCRSLWESVGWHRGVTLDPKMHSDDNNIALALNIDGFQPFNRGGITLHPLLLQVLNLPENLRHRAEFMVLAGIIPGKQAPKNLNTYMEPMVDELLRLYTKGFVYYDPNLKTPRRAFVKLLFTACDFPGHAFVNCMQKQASAFACHKCDIVGVVKPVNEGGTCRVLYGDFKGLARTPEVKPHPLTDAVYRQRAANFERLTEQHKSDFLDAHKARSSKMTLTKLKEKKSDQCRQVKGLSQLARLPGFDMVDHTLLDLMHTV